MEPIPDACVDRWRRVTRAGSERDAQPGHVYLVGAGPGDPALLTLRAHRLLTTATLILPDGLVSPEILALAAPGARVLPVGKRCGSASTTQAEINRLLVTSAQRGEAVLRLKSGDPLVFGRVAEELAALQAAGVPVEVVPGISAAFAAAASLQTPLTDRSGASKLILATAHRASGDTGPSAVHEAVWQGPLPADATLAIYMPGRALETLSAELIRSGMDPETPVAAVSQISTPQQRAHTSALRDLRAEDCGPAPLLLLIGRSIPL